jgi:hypothetical protein
VQDRLDVPVALAVSDTGVTVNGWHVKPAGTVSVRATEPAKLNVLVRVTVEEIDEPVVPVGEVALIEKSPACETKPTECTRLPLVAVIMTR